MATVHNEKGERMSNFVFGYMINGLHQSNEAEAARNRDRDRTLAWFEEKFGQALDAPLPPAIDLTSATTQFKELQLQTSNPPWTPSAKTSPVSTAFSSPRTHHQYITFNRPPAGWGSSLVDKWWEGNWSHQVSVPLELQHQADTYSYYHHSRSNPSSPPSEGHDTVYGFSRPTSPTLARPKSPSAKARDPMKESLITEYGDRLSVSARWQPTFRPQLRPPKLKRHLTA
jgi:hypothetical protein